MSFVNLHVHSAQGSLLDSILTIEQMVKYAVDNKQPAIALSDHGTMHGFVDQVELCNKHGIKPIVACEIYEVDNYLEKQDTKEYKQPRYHLLLVMPGPTAPYSSPCCSGCSMCGKHDLPSH